MHDGGESGRQLVAEGTHRGHCRNSDQSGDQTILMAVAALLVAEQVAEKLHRPPD